MCGHGAEKHTSTCLGGKRGAAPLIDHRPAGYCAPLQRSPTGGATGVRDGVWQMQGLGTDCNCANGDPSSDFLPDLSHASAPPRLKSRCCRSRGAPSIKKKKTLRASETFRVAVVRLRDDFRDFQTCLEVMMVFAVMINDL
ncbi:hypothetical protein E2C01_016141 [Portunus trituberculatus]|uniref:Uncharacterized protein n=1 Tax=Portunus trituberculatus TaxID=210409 RepID=A0A5B7DQ56_PORTR|nr:hypothetical protein [Portunus trituberculatus]